ncbi:MAG: hypothetical protein JW844_00405 [Candidatus Omnitrophica bacterium]|nr:hypothetical protein [Candidatus Omnitrophota bacterium]
MRTKILAQVMTILVITLFLCSNNVWAKPALPPREGAGNPRQAMQKAEDAEKNHNHQKKNVQKLENIEKLRQERRKKPEQQTPPTATLADPAQKVYTSVDTPTTIRLAIKVEGLRDIGGSNNNVSPEEFAAMGLSLEFRRNHTGAAVDHYEINKLGDVYIITVEYKWTPSAAEPGSYSFDLLFHDTETRTEATRIDDVLYVEVSSMPHPTVTVPDPHQEVRTTVGEPTTIRQAIMVEGLRDIGDGSMNVSPEEFAALGLTLDFERNNTTAEVDHYEIIKRGEGRYLIIVEYTWTPSAAEVGYYSFDMTFRDHQTMNEGIRLNDVLYVEVAPE